MNFGKRAKNSLEASVEMRYKDENNWLTQKMMATHYDVSVPAINQHLKRIFMMSKDNLSMCYVLDGDQQKEENDDLEK